MNRLVAFAVSAAFVVGMSPALAAGEDEHAGHHPEAAPTTQTSSARGAATGSVTADSARMDVQLRAMRDMHRKMMAAKTPKERDALMARHMKAMREGMSMMHRMSERESGGMSMDNKGMAGTDMGMGSMNGSGKPAMPMMDMTAHHQMMEKRMQMMNMMMEMMMDRMPAAPAS